jgi:hypothetical protein
MVLILYKFFKFYITTKGFIGFIPDSIKINNIIIVFFRARILFIFRKYENINIYYFVREYYKLIILYYFLD